MALRQVEQNTALCVQCPNCSKLFEVTDTRDEGGRTIAFYNMKKAPGECNRCGGPMDMKEAVVFGEKNAEREAKLYGPLAPLKRLVKTAAE